MANRYMRKPYRCSVCFRSFDTFVQAEAHWLEVHEARDAALSRARATQETNSE
jgi:hypothetical protein